MAPQKVVTKVWIEPGCIVCDACETTAPKVFHVTDDNCTIRPEALNSSFTKPITQAIIDAALECPVNVIKYETVVEEVSPAPAGPPIGGPAAPAPKPAAEPATAVAAKATTAVKISVAGTPDPAIAVPHRTTTARGDCIRHQSPTDCALLIRR